MEVALVAVRPDSPDGLTALRAYADELARRWPDLAPGPTWSETFLADDPLVLAPPSGVLVVAKEGDRVVGCAGLRWEGADVPAGAGEIKRMWVDPDVRGQRLGTRLLDHLTDLAREAGLRRLVLDTAERPDRGPGSLRPRGLRRDRALQHQPLRAPLVQS